MIFLIFIKILLIKIHEKQKFNYTLKYSTKLDLTKYYEI